MTLKVVHAKKHLLLCRRFSGNVLFHLVVKHVVAEGQCGLALAEQRSVTEFLGDCFAAAWPYCYASGDDRE